MYSINLEFDVLPKMNTAHSRRHWSVHAKESADWRYRMRIAVGRNKPERPLPRSRVVMTRCSASEPDHDNLAVSFKPILDALTMSRPSPSKKRFHRMVMRADVIEDDSPKHVEREYRWEYAKKGKILIQIEELADG